MAQHRLEPEPLALRRMLLLVIAAAWGSEASAAPSVTATYDAGSATLLVTVSARNDAKDTDWWVPTQPSC